MLHVDGPDHVDPCIQQREHVLVTLAVARPGRVGMRDLVDHGDGGPAQQRRVQIHLLDDHAAILDAAAGNDFQPLDQRRGLRAAVRLDEGDHHVDPPAPQVVRLLQHPVRLADPGGETDVQLETAAPRAFDELEEVLGPPRLRRLRHLLPGSFHHLPAPVAITTA